MVAESKFASFSTNAKVMLVLMILLPSLGFAKPTAKIKPKARVEPAKSVAAPPAAPVNSYTQHLLKSNYKALLFTPDGGKGNSTVDLNAVAIDRHYALAPLHNLIGFAYQPGQRLLLQNFAGIQVEAKIADLDIRNDLILLYCAQDLPDFLTWNDLSPASQSQNSANVPWTFLNFLPESDNTIAALPGAPFADHFFTLLSMTIGATTPKTSPFKKDGSLLLTKNRLVAGVYLGRRPSMINMNSYCTSETLARWMGQLHNASTMDPLLSQISSVREEIFQDMQHHRSSDSVEFGPWALSRLPSALNCYTGNDAGTKICESQWPFYLSQTETAMRAKLTLKNLRTGGEAQLREQIQDYEIAAKSQFKDILQSCRQRRLQLFDGQDLQLRTCVGSAFPFRKKALLQGVVLFRKAPLFFELEMVGFESQQTQFLAQSILDGLQWRPNGTH